MPSVAKDSIKRETECEYLREMPELSPNSIKTSQRDQGIINFANLKTIFVSTILMMLTGTVEIQRNGFWLKSWATWKRFIEVERIC